MYAYEGSTGKFLGEGVLPEYANVRRGEATKGQLYFGVRLAGTGTGTGGGGAIIKWPGSKQDPLKFEVVATLRRHAGVASIGARGSRVLGRVVYQHPADAGARVS